MSEQLGPIPVVISDRWLENGVVCISPTHALNQTGRFELQCNQQTFEVISSEVMEEKLLKILVNGLAHYFVYGEIHP